MIKRMKKRFILILVTFFALCSFATPAFAYDIPETSCYINANVSTFGNITLYIPCDEINSFSLLDETTPINITSSSISAYFSYGSEDLTMRFSPYTLPTVSYRATGNQSTTVTVTFNEITETNITFSSSYLINIQQNYYYYIAAFIFGALFVGLLRLFRGGYTT